ncbi:MAG: transferrin receptor-like dimerization domain-containing protein [Acidobacteriaceae bacterium]
MRRFAIAFLSVSLAAIAAEPTATGPLRGYTAAHSTAEVAWEQKFRAIPDEARLRENMRRLSARPHHVGSPYDKDNAEWLLAQLKSFGLDAKIEEFSALFPTPKSRELVLLSEPKFIPKLEEPTIAVDPTSGQKSEQLPTYNAYSRDGDVTAPLVYVNYGAPADYVKLAEMGVSVKGAIVIARYGETWRGIKPKVAAQHGAVGCLIYSDPKDDGYSRGGSYPDGPMRPPDGVQRGSVMDMPVYPGDPQTPGVGAKPGVKLIPLDKVQTITKIPVMPLSYADALPFLRALGGQTVPESWRGDLPITYRTGPSKVMAHFAISFNWDRKPLYDVVATIPGATLPGQWVIRGNHHDAWVNGAGDPISGTSAELEEARGLGELLKQGWKPQRTIIYCFWDGEEPALLGSTEWGEYHADELREHAVAYFNSDSNGRGFFRAGGSHSLENFIDNVVKDIQDPETGMSVWKRAHLAAELRPSAMEAPMSSRNHNDTPIGALGSGSDYTVFIDHLGVPSANLGYGGEDQGGGQYHSVYDDFYWYTHFEDTTFAYGRALAQTAGTMMMRMADADVIPYQFTDQAGTVHDYVTEVEKLAVTMRAQIKRQNINIEDGAYKAIADPKKVMVPPTVESVPPYFNFAPLDQASDDLTAAAAEYEKAFSAHGDSGDSAVDMQLVRVVHTLTDPKGLPNRPWFENMVYAPGFYTGYGVKTLPAVREAIEQKQWTMVDVEIERTAAAIEREAEALKAATTMLAKS